VFPELTQARLRTDIARACRATGTPLWSRHGLRHRRPVALAYGGRPGRRDGPARVGQRRPSTTLDRYSHVVLERREIDRAALLQGPAS
jgi:integrase